MKTADDDLDLLLDPEFLTQHDSLFAELLGKVTWDESMRARKTASFGRPYNYSQMTYRRNSIPECLRPVCDCLRDRLSIVFNNCLLNLYETGENTMGFHADETRGLAPNTGVAIVSLGSSRTITFRRLDRSCLVEQRLEPGSLLYMDNRVQDEWMHAIRKQPGTGPRISLTWRAVV